MLLLAASPFCGDSHSALSSIVTELMASDNLSSSCLSGLYSLCMLMFCHFSLFSACSCCVSAFFLPSVISVVF